MSDNAEASSSTTPTPSKPTVTFIKRSRPRPQSSRQRSPSPSSASKSNNDASGSGSGSDVIRPQARTTLNPLLQGTKRLVEERKRRREEEERDRYRGDDAWGDEDKRTGYATRGSDWDVSTTPNPTNPNSPAAGAATGIKRPRLDEDGNILPSDGLYHGSSHYTNHLKLTERESQMSNKMKAGPQKASANIRSITVTDYQPDVCKDYKETGFCGYGDSCKFLHDRSDYLAGWQLDQLVVNPSTGAPPAVQDEEEEEDVPFACLICRKGFTEPVVTKCGHYFCMNCAIKRFQKTPKCYACGLPTGGMFNKAEKILGKMTARNEALRKRKAEEAGSDAGGEEGEGGIEFGGEGEGENEEDEEEE